MSKSEIFQEFLLQNSEEMKRRKSSSTIPLSSFLHYLYTYVYVQHVTLSASVLRKHYLSFCIRLDSTAAMRSGDDAYLGHIH